MVVTGVFVAVWRCNCCRELESGIALCSSCSSIQGWICRYTSLQQHETCWLHPAVLHPSLCKYQVAGKTFICSNVQVICRAMAMLLKKPNGRTAVHMGKVGQCCV